MTAILTISMPEALQKYISTQVKERYFSSSSEYVRFLVRKDKEEKENKNETN